VHNSECYVDFYGNLLCLFFATQTAVRRLSVDMMWIFCYCSFTSGDVRSSVSLSLSRWIACNHTGEDQL